MTLLTNFLVALTIVAVIFGVVYALRDYLEHFQIKMRLVAFATMLLSFLTANDMTAPLMALMPDRYDWTVTFGLGALIWALREVTSNPGAWVGDERRVEVAAQTLSDAPDELSVPVVADQLAVAPTDLKAAAVVTAMANEPAGVKQDVAAEIKVS